MLHELVRRLQAHGVSATICSRVERLNPAWREGRVVRGLHLYANPSRSRPLVGKRAFIARFGRSAWDMTPNSVKVKSGRRYYVFAHAVAQQIWRCFDPKNDPRCDFYSVPTSRRFSNDPQLEMQILTAAEFREWRAKNFAV